METMAQRLTGERRKLVDRLFPAGVPALWCPPLTHFDEHGGIDRARTRAHLEFMRPHVGGFLVPGSTGEGWDLAPDEAHELVEFMEGEIRRIGAHLLVGALHPSAEGMIRAIRGTLEAVAPSWAHDPLEALEATAVRGFAVCPPRGARLSQGVIRAALEEVLALGVPVALYQLPQMTQNEMAPETVAALAERHPNVYLLKDSSGGDRVAASGLRELLLVRGAESDYASHLARNGGRYDGFLLSTANCFPGPLSAVIAGGRNGESRKAEAFSRALTALAAELLPLAAQVGYGNPYANANKALDQFFAHGPAAEQVPPPRVHGGKQLPRELVEAAGAALRRRALMPERGYLDAA